ncbi:MAG: helix-turn-helix domain-containing protein [Taibaiella sp.]|nr:helix-turn-helix domain-containing protein [Taibaiella sp.]
MERKERIFKALRLKKQADLSDIGIKEYDYWYIFQDRIGQKRNWEKNGPKFKTVDETVLHKLKLIRILSKPQFSSGITKSQLELETKKHEIGNLSLTNAYRWVKVYNKYGFTFLMNDRRRGGNRAHVFDENKAQFIAAWMKRRRRKGDSYKKLLDALNEEFEVSIPYTTLYNYLKRMHTKSVNQRKTK